MIRSKQTLYNPDFENALQFPNLYYHAILMEPIFLTSMVIYFTAVITNILFYSHRLFHFHMLGYEWPRIAQTSSQGSCVLSTETGGKSARNDRILRSTGYISQI